MIRYTALKSTNRQNLRDVLPLAKPAFWWEGPGGSRILSYRPAVGWRSRSIVYRRIERRMGLHHRAGASCWIRSSKGIEL